MQIYSKSEKHYGTKTLTKWRNNQTQWHWKVPNICPMFVAIRVNGHVKWSGQMKSQPPSDFKYCKMGPLKISQVKKLKHFFLLLTKYETLTVWRRAYSFSQHIQFVLWLPFFFWKERQVHNRVTTLDWQLFHVHLKEKYIWLVNTFKQF